MLEFITCPASWPVIGLYNFVQFDIILIGYKLKRYCIEPIVGNSVCVWAYSVGRISDVFPNAPIVRG